MTNQQPQQPPNQMPEKAVKTSSGLILPTGSSQRAAVSEAFRNAHVQSDVDSDRFAQHHTLGSAPNQAAPGNHAHTADYAAADHNHDADYLGIEPATIKAAVQVAIPGMFFDGTETVLFGAAPPAGTAKVFKQSTQVKLLNGASNAVMTWNEGAFANGLVSVVMISGDATVFIGTVSTFTYSLAGCSIAARNPAPGAINIRINYIAIGW